MNISVIVTKPEVNRIFDCKQQGTPFPFDVSQIVENLNLIGCDLEHVKNSLRETTAEFVMIGTRARVALGTFHDVRHPRDFLATVPADAQPYALYLISQLIPGPYQGLYPDLEAP